MSVRAGIVVTGTEVLSGIVRDENGPWLAERLRSLGVELAHTVVTGDRPSDLSSALAFVGDLDLVITSGGLGPTADDLTAEVVAEFAGRPLELDPGLEARIWAIVEPFRSRWPSASEEGMREGARKQALVPRGASVLEPEGTAPGLVVPVDGGPVVVVLPGPPRELRPMWSAALSVPAVRSVVDRAGALDQRIMRMTGVPESELALMLRELDPPGSLEITTCLRRGELEIATVFSPSVADAYLAFESAVLERFGRKVFSRDGATIDEIVAGLLLGPPVRTVALAESCTGGLMAARLTDRPGSSAYVLGGVVVYSNEAKVAHAGVPAGLIASFGAVSPEVAASLADGAAERFGAEVGIGITGIAGPGGGTPEKPVGTVCVCVSGPEGVERVERTFHVPGDRAAVRERTTTAGMHLLRRALLAGAERPSAA